jgi:phage tail sheath gpL-like
MPSLQRPSITLNISPTITKPTIQHRVLIIGEIGDNSTVETDKVIEDIQIKDIDIFGKDSQIYYAIEKFKSINKLNILDVLVVKKGSNKSTSDITITGTATKNNKLSFTLNNNFVEVVINNLDTDITIATNLESVLNENSYFTDVFTISRTDNKVTLETKQPSATLNNHLSIISLKYIDDGITTTITRFTGGSSNTLQDDYLSNKLDERYNSIIYDYSLGLNAVRVYLESQFNLLNKINDGVGFTTIRDNLTNFKSIVDNQNYKTQVIFGNLFEMEYNVSSLVATAEIVAIRALRLTNKANISNYVSQNIETFGGISLASLPYFNTPLTFPKPDGCIDEEDLINVLNVGGSLWVNNGTTVLSEVVTTYKKNNLGDEDKSFKYLNYVDTLSVIREYLTISLRKRYSQTRLTNSDLIPNKSITNKGAIKASIIKYLNELADLALVRKGLDKFISDNLSINEDLETGTITFSCKVPIVVQFRTIQGNLIEVLEIESSI